MMAASATMDLSLGWTPPVSRERVSKRTGSYSTTASPNPEQEMHDPSDEALVTAIVGGDPEGFRLLIDRHQGKILGTASRFARNRQELEDLSQEIFLKAWKGLPSFKATAPFEHWLMRLAIRVCYDFLRKNRRHRENEISKEIVDGEDQRLTADPDGNPDLEAGEAREVLHHAMARLNPKEQLILTLRELERKSVREIAELTGWTESNVKVRAMRARQKLKQTLIELGYAE